MQNTTEDTSKQEEKSKLLREMKTTAYDYLQEMLIVDIEEIENLLVERHGEAMANFNDNLTGKKRTEAENLTDWVKAQLTKDINTAKIDNTYYWLPMAGQVHGVALVACSDTYNLLRAMKVRFTNE